MRGTKGKGSLFFSLATVLKGRFNSNVTITINCNTIDGIFSDNTCRSTVILKFRVRLKAYKDNLARFDVTHERISTLVLILNSGCNIFRLLLHKFFICYLTDYIYLFKYYEINFVSHAKIRLSEYTECIRVCR